MRGVSVRGAGGLVIGVVIQPIITVLDNPMVGRQDGMFDAFRRVFWVPDGYDPPFDTTAFLILRGLLVFAGLVLGVLALLGVRPVRFPLAAVCAVLALGVLTWVIWPYDPVDFRNFPPDWLMDHPLWFLSTRGTAVVLLLMLLAALVLAVTDSGRVASSPPFPAGAWGPAGAYGPGPGPGPYPPGQPVPSGQWAPAPPGDKPPPPVPTPAPAPPPPAPDEPRDAPPPEPPPEPPADDGPHGTRTPF